MCEDKDFFSTPCFSNTCDRKGVWLHTLFHVLGGIVGKKFLLGISPHLQVLGLSHSSIRDIQCCFCST